MLNSLSSLASVFKTNEKDFLIGKSKTSIFKKTGTHFLEKETALQFQLMQNAALQDGIEIEIASAFRSFSRQKKIFESKFEALQKENKTALEAIQQIIRYSSIPGTSRHHWGTEIDIIQKIDKNLYKGDVLSTSHFSKGGAFYDLHLWMQKNAASFGFYLSYTDAKDRTGFLYEPWHYSYLPSSKKYLKAYLQYNMQDLIQTEKVKGFHALDREFFNNYFTKYILGINPILK